MAIRIADAVAQFWDNHYEQRGRKRIHKVEFRRNINKLPGDRNKQHNGCGSARRRKCRWKLSVGKTQAKVGGTIDQKFSSTGTPASTTETDLHSFTTVASSLGTDGDGFTMTSGGTFAGNASATSQLRVYFGGTQIFASGALTAASAASWHIECMIIRDSSTTVRCVTKFTTASAVSAPLVTQTDVTGLTLSSSNILKVTGQGGGASPASNDIVYKLGRIRFEPVY